LTVVDVQVSTIVNGRTISQVLEEVGLKHVDLSPGDERAEADRQERRSN
jgi:hypothetical protein